MDTRATTTELFGPQLQRLQGAALGMIAVGLILCIAGAAMNIRGFFHSYLFAYLFWIGVTTGCLGMLMLHHTVGGGWGFVIRRFLEAGTRLLLPMAVLFLPVVLGLLQYHLYEWNTPEAANDAMLRQKALWLNVPFFLGRTAAYFLIWMGFAFCFNRWGNTQNERRDAQVSNRLNVLGGFGIVVYVLIASFAIVDWVMSLTPHWYSSIFGLLAVASQALSTLALMLVLIPAVTPRTILRQVPDGFFRDLGNLTLAVVMLWAYLSFSQYLIIFSGNTAEEVSWYERRGQGGWQAIGACLIAFHFAFPFLVLLLGSKVKRDPARLGRLALFIIFMRFVDLFWLVAPTFRDQFGITLADVGAPVLIGGIWLWLWARELKAANTPIIPAHDPRIETHLHEVPAHG